MKIIFKGRCLSGFQSKLVISTSDKFEIYRHDDSLPPQYIPFDVDSVVVNNHLVSIGRQQCVNVVEHLFSALFALNIFNVRIDVYGDEVPFYDGSSYEFFRRLKDIKNNNIADVLQVDKQVFVEEDGSFIHYNPSKYDNLVISMKFDHPYINKQEISLLIDEENYRHEIAPARTFAFIDENDPRLRNLPPYGIGITNRRMYSIEPLRYSNELVRHKLLDLIGDLFVLKKPIFGKIECSNTFHRLNLRFVRKLLQNAHENEG